MLSVALPAWQRTKRRRMNCSIVSTRNGTSEYGRTASSIALGGAGRKPKKTINLQASQPSKDGGRAADQRWGGSQVAGPASFAESLRMSYLFGPVGERKTTVR